MRTFFQKPPKDCQKARVTVGGNKVVFRSQIFSSPITHHPPERLFPSNDCIALMFALLLLKFIWGLPNSLLCANVEVVRIARVNELCPNTFDGHLRIETASGQGTEGPQMEPIWKYIFSQQAYMYKHLTLWLPSFRMEQHQTLYPKNHWQKEMRFAGTALINIILA